MNATYVRSPEPAGHGEDCRMPQPKPMQAPFIIGVAELSSRERRLYLARDKRHSAWTCEPNEAQVFETESGAQKKCDSYGAGIGTLIVLGLENETARIDK